MADHESSVASQTRQDSESVHGPDVSVEHAEGDRPGASNDAKAYARTFTEEAVQGALVVADVSNTDNPNQGVTQIISNWHDTHQIVRGEVQERREQTQEVATRSSEADTVFFGHLRRWRCSYRAGEPSWGLIFSDIHSCDIVFAQQQDAGIDFNEGDLVAFQNLVREDGYSSAGKAWKITHDELETIRTRLSDSAVLLRNSQAIDLPVNSEPENPPGNHQPVAAPPAVEPRHRAHEQYQSNEQMPLMPAHPAFPPQVQAHVMPHHQLQQACGTVPAGARQAPLSYEPPQPQPQQQQQPPPQVQQPPPGYPGFERNPGAYQQVPHHAQPPNVGQGTQWQQQQQQQQQQQRPPQMATRILVEPPPMLDKFDAKATAQALLSGQWRGKRAISSPRTWQVSMHGSTSFQIGQEWLEALQQGISAMHAAHIEEEQQQAQQHAAAAAAWGGTSPQQWMWNNSPNGVDMLPCF
eukprot:TRINITY_DN3462_c2_g4_i1.p1 TRINITY_DN3462_c2_g4~~TRINITY_DN3462_c2_g4_i1.p1  ORF type:complete len:466 (+),score=97.00 TRINITY_DN3462_c2_g4_i1:196-1593(+)